MFRFNGKEISLDHDLVIGEGDEAITHPAANLQDAATRAALGIIEVPDPVRPDDTLFWVTDNGDGTFSTTPKSGIVEVKIADAIKAIDIDADAIYTAALGNRATEYAQAEADAQIYKTSGYTGTVPIYVQAWADAKSQTAKWAAEDILLTAAAWRTAQTAIRTHRLACKETIRKIVAADESAEALLAAISAINAVKAQWGTISKAIREQLGVS